jgi:ABC-type multidrug transport system fused ATPase/permease subunit
MLGERAANLSGGQRQRIAIARAFIRDAPLLILDEPTTGLDAAATEQVLLGLRSLMEGKTTVIVSHDLNLISSADGILVIDEGRIVEAGDHQSLLGQEGTYARYFDMQSSSLREETPAPPPAPAAETNGNGSVDALTQEQLSAAVDLMATVKRILGR